MGIRALVRAAALLALAAAVSGIAAVVVAAMPTGRAAVGERSAARRNSWRSWQTFGRSAHGRRLRVVELRWRRPGPTLLVVGCIHGDECAGTPIAWHLIAGPRPTRGSYWVVPNLNPDGRRRGWRLNGRGVDLNRNFPAGWRPAERRGEPEYSGPRPFSEPETRAVRRLVERIRPDITVWYHQPLTMVRAWGRSVAAARRYAALCGLPFRRIPWLAGTAPNWQNHRFAGMSAFVVELPPGKLTAVALRRHLRALRALTRPA